MEELINFAIEKGGIIALLIIIVLVLWIQFSRHSVPKEAYTHLLKRVDAIDDDINKGVIPSLQKLTEVQKETQVSLVQLNRTQELNLLVSQAVKQMEVDKKTDKPLIGKNLEIPHHKRTRYPSGITPFTAKRPSKRPTRYKIVKPKLDELMNLLDDANDNDIDRIIQNIKKGKGNNE